MNFHKGWQTIEIRATILSQILDYQLCYACYHVALCTSQQSTQHNYG